MTGLPSWLRCQHHIISGDFILFIDFYSTREVEGNSLRISRWKVKNCVVYFFCFVGGVIWILGFVYVLFGVIFFMWSFWLVSCFILLFSFFKFPFCEIAWPSILLTAATMVCTNSPFFSLNLNLDCILRKGLLTSRKLQRKIIFVFFIERILICTALRRKCTFI